MRRSRSFGRFSKASTPSVRQVFAYLDYTGALDLTLTGLRGEQ